MFLDDFFFTQRRLRVTRACSRRRGPLVSWEPWRNRVEALLLHDVCFQRRLRRSVIVGDKIAVLFVLIRESLEIFEVSLIFVAWIGGAAELDER
jgi:hypothetical protein